MAQSVISIIIPVLNEAKIINKTLAQLTQYPEIEVIVVDGGSQDNTVAIVKGIAKSTVKPKVKVLTVKGQERARQMNAGADVAQSDIFLFLHADTQLPPNFIELATKTLEQDKTIAGAFDLKITGSSISLRLVEMLVKLRLRLFSMPYGDQGIFISKQAFIKAGRFADLPIMEDFEFIRRVKNLGKVAIAPGAVKTSGRRWQKLGVWQTTLINQLMIIGYYLGISPKKLGKFYRQNRRPKPSRSSSNVKH